MILVIYRWRVSEGNRSAFVDTWELATQRIRETTTGARGSICIVSAVDPTEILTVAKWMCLEHWNEFMKTAGDGPMRDLHNLGKQTACAAYEQVGDHMV